MGNREHIEQATNERSEEGQGQMDWKEQRIRNDLDREEVEWEIDQGLDDDDDNDWRLMFGKEWGDI